MSNDSKVFLARFRPSCSSSYDVLDGLSDQHSQVGFHERVQFAIEYGLRIPGFVVRPVILHHLVGV